MYGSPATVHLYSTQVAKMNINKFLFTNTDGFYEESLVNGFTLLRACDISLSIGDLVYESNTLVNGVDKATDNFDIRAVLGIVIDKPSDTTAVILQLGVLGGFSNLTVGKKVYLSSTGGMTTTIPDSGYIQIIGITSSDTTIYIHTGNTKIKQAPIGYGTSSEANSNPVVVDTSDITTEGMSLVVGYLLR